MSSVDQRIARLSPAERRLLELHLQARQGARSPTSVITRRTSTGPAPLSYAQQRLWFLDQLQPGLTAYNTVATYRLRGPLNDFALQYSLDEILRRHEILRTTFVVEHGQPWQVVQPAAGFPLSIENFTHLPAECWEAEIERCVEREGNRPFDLSRDIMRRATLLRFGSQEHVLIFTSHHITSDAWSGGVLWRELGALYGAFVKSEPVDLPEPPIQYADYAIWQRQWLQSDQAQAQMAYWRAQLAGAPPLLDLPTDRPRPAQQSMAGAAQSFIISQSLLDDLKALARQAGATLFMTLLTGFNIFLYRYTGQDDLLVGAPIAGRVRSELEGLIGFFLNNLVLRSRLSPTLSVQELLAQVRETTLNAYSNQELPFEAILESLQPDRELSHTPLFQVMLILQNTPRSPLQLEGVDVERLAIGYPTAKLDLTFAFSEQQDHLRGSVEYSTDLFDAATIHGMIGHFQTILAAMVANPRGHVATLPMLTEAEERQLRFAYNDTTVDYGHLPSLAQRFHAQVAATPTAVAFLCGDEQITYAELNRRANQLAHVLAERGVSTGVRVGLCIDRSLEMAIALLAIFKAGGVYVPLDPSYPTERLAFIVQDASLALVLSLERVLNRLDAAFANALRQRCFCLDAGQSLLDRQPESNLDRETGPGDLAYMIYTSGSTGQPKGVAVPHGQMLNRFAWMWQMYPLQANDRGCQKTALNFVDSLWELFGYLLQGKPTVIIPDESVRDVHALVQSLAQHGVTQLWLVPSLLRSMLLLFPDLQKRLPALKFWVVSGEPLSVQLFEQFQAAMPRATLYNLYGTSEVWDATWFDPAQPHAPWRGATIPIGRPISNVQTYVLDHNRQLAPMGAPGELYVGGVGLAAGYVNQPELTAERFVVTPWEQPPAQAAAPGATSSFTAHGNGERLYRTGDLARWLPDGNLEFLGRSDFQVKVRGHRIELEEIETQLGRHPAVKQTVVVARQHDGEPQLVAYVIPQDGAAPTGHELMSFLRSRLPEAMIPARFVVLSALPLTPSGKIDRKALPVPDAVHAPAIRPRDAPITPAEEKLAVIWAELLGLSQVGVHESFFDLGGHSLLAVRLFARMEEEFGVRLPLALLFRSQTIAGLAPHLAQPTAPREWRTLVTIQAGQDRPPFFCVHGFGGGVLGYADLARLLGSAQPFYGLQAAGLDGDEAPDLSVAVMAARYIAAMRSVQARGPYRMGGYCFGGVVAFEMARQLEAQGEEVALLAVMEGYAPGARQRSTRLFDAQRLLTIWRNLPYWLEDYWQLGAHEINQRARRKVQRWRRRLTSESHTAAPMDIRDVLPHDVAYVPAHQRRLMEIHLAAMRAYRPQPYGGVVTLFAARGRTITSALSGSLDPQRGWGALALGGVAVRVVEGGHRNIHLPPNVGSLAAALSEELA